MNRTAAITLVALTMGWNLQALAADPPQTPGLPGAAQAPAPDGGALGQAMNDHNEVRMEVVSAVRAGGILTVRLRFTLTAGKGGQRDLPGSDMPAIYLTAGGKKFLLLKDDHGDYLMANDRFPKFDAVGAVRTWWGKFPGPAADVKAVDLYFPGFDPVENVPVTDR